MTDKEERAKVVAYLERVAAQDAQKARMAAHEQEVTGNPTRDLQNFYLISAQRTRELAYGIKSGMHRKRMPKADKETR